MRTINRYDEKPEELKVVNLGERSVVFVRRDIEEHTDVEEGTYWQAVEYSAEVNSLNLSITDAFIEHLMDAEADAAAKVIREKRNELLDETDKEMAIDRIEREPEEIVTAWKAYRQALRDIPEQEGFPFDVEWPVKP